MRVEVPVKSTLKKGTIAKIKSHSIYGEVKSIARVLSAEAEVAGPLWDLAHWMAIYYSAPLQRVLKCFIPVNVRSEVKEKTQIFLTLAKTHNETLQAIG